MLRFSGRILAASTALLAIASTLMGQLQERKPTKVVATFQENGEPASNARIDVLDVHDAEKIHYSAATDANGIRIIDADALDPAVEYFFTMRRAGYRLAYHKNPPGGELHFILTPKYGRPVAKEP